MPGFPREELEEMLRRWRDVNRRAEAAGDWSGLADFYTEDAIYTWNNGPRHEFVARGRQQIRDWVCGSEMQGLEGWTYPYVRTLIDEVKGEVVGFWRQLAPRSGSDGPSPEILGTGGSWFRYAGGFRWCWQRDFFDHANAAAVFLELAKDGRLSEAMQVRMKKGSRMPGWVPAESLDWYATIPDREDDAG